MDQNGYWAYQNSLVRVRILTGFVTINNVH